MNEPKQKVALPKKSYLRHIVKESRSGPDKIRYKLSVVRLTKALMATSKVKKGGTA